MPTILKKPKWTFYPSWIAVRLIAGENLAGPLDIMFIAVLPACVTAATFAWLLNQIQPTEPQGA